MFLTAHSTKLAQTNFKGEGRPGVHQAHHFTNSVLHTSSRWSSCAGLLEPFSDVRQFQKLVPVEDHVQAVGHVFNGIPPAKEPFGTEIKSRDR